MQNKTEPSAGALRAAQEIKIGQCSSNCLSERSEMARIIDTETGAKELIEGLESLDRYLIGSELWEHGVMRGDGKSNVITPAQLVRSLLCKHRGEKEK